MIPIKDDLKSAGLLVLIAAIIAATLTGIANAESKAAQVRITTAEPIPQILLEIGLGVVGDATRDGTGLRGSRGILPRIGGIPGRLSGTELRIDGQPRSGTIPWVYAALRVVAYAFDLRTDGSVQIANGGPVAGLFVTRRTTISDDAIQVVARFVKTEFQRGKQIPVAVLVTLDVATIDGVTTILVTASGEADLANLDCRLVRWIAGRVAPGEVHAGLVAALATAERRGRQLHASGRDSLHVRIETVLDSIGKTRLIGSRN